MPKIAVIGAGRWGKNIIRTVASIADLHTICYGGSAETKTHLEENYPAVALTTDHHEILNDPEVTVVFIATPIPTHETFVREALVAGKHVFVEKPLSLDTEAIDALYALAQEKNRTLFVGYIYTYDPAFLHLKELLEGETDVTVETLWTKYGTFDSALSENLLVHELALAHELLGSLELKEITRNEENVFDGNFEGVRGTAHIFIDREREEKKKILTVRVGAITYTLANGTLTKEEEDGTQTTLHETSGQLLEIELQNFIAETKEGSRGNEKRRSMDRSIAAVLGRLSSTL